MKILLLSALLAVAFASDVIELTDDTFRSGAAGRDVMLVEFFAPWCGHCKKLAPEYEKAATSLKRGDTPVPLAKVDCTANTEVCSKYGVSGYPTLKIFRNGEFAEDYNGPREADGIVKYMKGKAGPTSKSLTDTDTAEKFLSFPETAIVGFFSSEESSLAKLFKSTADSLSEKFRFAHSVDEAVNTKYGYDNQIVIFYPTVMHNKFEDKLVVFSGDETSQALKSFVQSNAYGFCGVRSQSSAADFQKKPLVVAYFDVDYVKNPKGSNYWRNRVMKVGKKLVDLGKKLNFAISNVNDFRQELEEYGLTYTEKPLVAVRDSKDQKFPMQAEFSMDNLEEFLNDFLEGKLEAYLKSEPVPDNSENAVKVAVAKNFDELVNDPERDVLIEFYAPWCGHCKSLEPKYKELAEKLANEDGITIVKMDATANDVPQPYNVRGFPTLYFAPKGNKSNPKKYEGGRELEDFLSYLSREATDELKGYDRSGKEKKIEL